MSSRDERPEVISIVIADDHHLIRLGTRSMLSGEPDLEIVGEAEDGRAAVELCYALKPDVVLMDVRMPDLDGLAATRAIKGERPDTAVIMLTMHESEDYLLEALRAGAAGYVLKGSTQNALIAAIRASLDGGSPLDDGLASRLLKRLALEKERPPTSPGGAPLGESRPTGPLTPRETEVLGYLARGMTNPQIARHLVLSSGTVKIHVQRIIRKLGVSDRTQAAVRAIELGLLSV